MLAPYNKKDILKKVMIGHQNVYIYLQWFAVLFTLRNTGLLLKQLTTFKVSTNLWTDRFISKNCLESKIRTQIGVIDNELGIQIETWLHFCVNFHHFHFQQLFLRLPEIDSRQTTIVKYLIHKVNLMGSCFNHGITTTHCQTNFVHIFDSH